MNYLSKAMEIIKEFEGLRLKPYYCDAGKLTVGYGHVILKTENYTQITKAEAIELLLKDLEKFNTAMNNCLKVELNDNQKSAILSLIFNIGITAFKNSTLLGIINIGAKQEQIKIEWMRWVHVKKKFNQGLYNRRLKEWSIYNG